MNARWIGQGRNGVLKKLCKELVKNEVDPPVKAFKWRVGWAKWLTQSEIKRERQVQTLLRQQAVQTGAICAIKAREFDAG